MTKKLIQQAEENMVADRLRLAAEHIRSDHKVPDIAICDAIGDSAWFREYAHICLQAPIMNSFLGCILFGWQLCEEYKRLEERVKVYEA